MSENLYMLPAFEDGCAKARRCISENDSGNGIEYKNPYHRDTVEFRAWNLGWNTTLQSEQP